MEMDPRFCGNPDEEEHLRLCPGPQLLGKELRADGRRALEGGELVPKHHGWNSGAGNEPEEGDGFIP